jgi:serine/threonine protein kinase
MVIGETLKRKKQD